jgi:hypothetical protein
MAGTTHLRHSETRRNSKHVVEGLLPILCFGEETAPKDGKVGKTIDSAAGGQTAWAEFL